FGVFLPSSGTREESPRGENIMQADDGDQRGRDSQDPRNVSSLQLYQSVAPENRSSTGQHQHQTRCVISENVHGGNRLDQAPEHQASDAEDGIHSNRAITRP